MKPGSWTAQGLQPHGDARATSLAVAPGLTPRSFRPLLGVRSPPHFRLRHKRVESERELAPAGQHSGMTPERSAPTRESGSRSSVCGSRRFSTRSACGATLGRCVVALSHSLSLSSACSRWWQPAPMAARVPTRVSTSGVHRSDGVRSSANVTGFSSPRPRLAHVVGRGGRIAALLFGYPLASPPAPRRNNKILWVSRRIPVRPTALWIRAQRMVGVRAVGWPVTRLVQRGPGPSIINLPAAGCWRLRLAWAGRTDTLDLRYRTP